MRKRGDVAGTVAPETATAEAVGGIVTEPDPAAKPAPAEAPPVVSELAKRREQAAEALEALTLGGGFDRVTEKVFAACNPEKDFDRVESELSIGIAAHRADYATIADALERSEDNARIAHRLLVASKVAHDRFEADAEVIATSMRDQAVVRLQGEKGRGERSKAITDADVVSMMAALFPDEWRATEERRSKAKRMTAHLERLADLWVSRCRTLSALLGSMRR